ncbi:hypothetical protein [Rhizobium bangladeshense]|uniref:hypothetical protein n=1 Tax=Rhizobium bangladeshense TaxID=1138189 RepID=UPI0012E80249|nr:hypothetical protein [Rhizobium bangladeshense]
MSTIGISATTGIRMMPSPAPASSPGAIVGVAKMASVIGEKNTHKNASACGSHLCRLSIRAMNIAETGMRRSKQTQAKAQGIPAGLSGNVDCAPSGFSEAAVYWM